MNTYSLEYCEELIDRYINDYKGFIYQISEGCLGLGEVILYGAPGKKSIILKEEYVSAWASTHKIRKYNKLPKKYELLINEI